MAKLAALWLPPTTTDSAHSGQYPLREPQGVTKSPQMAGTIVVPNLAQITRRGAVMPPREAGSPLTGGRSNLAARLQLWVWPLKGQSHC